MFRFSPIAGWTAKRACDLLKCKPVGLHSFLAAHKVVTDSLFTAYVKNMKESRQFLFLKSLAFTMIPSQRILIHIWFSWREPERVAPRISLPSSQWSQSPLHIWSLEQFFSHTAHRLYSTSTDNFRTHFIYVSNTIKRSDEFGAKTLIYYLTAAHSQLYLT